MKKNAEYGASEMSLSADEVQSLTAVGQLLEKYNFQGRPSLASPELGSAIPALMKIATQWQPPANRLAGLDTLRFIAASAKEFPAAATDELDAVASILSSGIFDADFIRSNNKLAMIAMRFFSNLLYGSTSGRQLVKEHLEDIIESLKPIAATLTADVSVAVALTTLYLNIAVLITSDKGGDADANANYGLSLVEDLTKALTAFPSVDHTASASPSAQSTEPAYRTTVALGTVLVGLKHPELTSAAKDIFGVPAALAQLRSKKYLDEPRFKSVVGEIQAVLR